MKEEKINFLWKRVVDIILHDETDLNILNTGLYHYTTPQGLVGILQSQKLWATESSFLNDSKEIHHGINLAQQIIENYISMNTSDIVKRFLNEILENLTFNYDEIYIVCFSEDGDLLSQWKGYSNFGEGFSIEFDSKELLREKRKFPAVNIAFKKVIYTQAEQEKIITSEIDFAIKYVNEVITQNPEIEKEIISNAASTTAYFIKNNSLRFKNNVFSEEKEWRAIYINNERTEEGRQEVCFKISGRIIVPYMELDIAASAGKKEWCLPIKKIIVGSKLNLKQTEKSISILCKQQKIPLIITEQSKIPLQ